MTISYRVINLKLEVPQKRLVDLSKISHSFLNLIDPFIRPIGEMGRKKIDVNKKKSLILFSWYFTHLDDFHIFLPKNSCIFLSSNKRFRLLFSRRLAWSWLGPCVIAILDANDDPFTKISLDFFFIFPREEHSNWATTKRKTQLSLTFLKK